MLSNKCNGLVKIARNITNGRPHKTFSNAYVGMERKETMDEKGRNPVTWVEAVENGKGKDLARKLLRKLDTRCVFSS